MQNITTVCGACGKKHDLLKEAFPGHIVSDAEDEVLSTCVRCGKLTAEVVLMFHRQPDGAVEYCEYCYQCYTDHELCCVL